MNLHKKELDLYLNLQPKKITFPPKPDGWTDGQTDKRIYRVASLLKMIFQGWYF